MVNTGENDKMSKLGDEYRFGINMPAEDAENFAEGVCKLVDSSASIKKMTRKLAEERFDKK